MDSASDTVRRSKARKNATESTVSACAMFSARRNSLTLFHLTTHKLGPTSSALT